MPSLKEAAKDKVKTFLTSLDIDTSALYKSLDAHPLYRHYQRIKANRQTYHILHDASVRNRFLRDSIESFNGPIAPKASSTIKRLVTIWESNGRLKWLEYANDDPNLQIFHLPRVIYSRIFRHLLKGYFVDPAHGDSNLDVYFKSTYEHSRRLFRQYCAQVAAFLSSHLEVDLVFMPKLNDDWTMDMIPATQSRGMPVVINDREGIMTYKRLEVVPPMVKSHLNFESDLLCVNNVMHKEFFVRAGYNPDKIEVLGRPDSDYWSRPNTWQNRKEIHPELDNDRTVVLFFAFGPRTYLNFYYGEEPRSWKFLSEAYHDVLLSILQRYGSKIQLVYKTGGKPGRDLFHGYDHFVDEINRMAVGDCFLPLNVNYNSLDLIRTSDVVLGFQTSGLIEAMFTNQAIIYGAWGDLFEDIKDTLLPFHKTQALMHARSQEHLEQMLIQSIEMNVTISEGSEVAAARKQMREYYYFKPDGKTSQRLLDASMPFLIRNNEA